MVMYILTSMAKALLGQFWCVSNFVQTSHIALSSCY